MKYSDIEFHSASINLVSNCQVCLSSLVDKGNPLRLFCGYITIHYNDVNDIRSEFYYDLGKYSDPNQWQ